MRQAREACMEPTCQFCPQQILSDEPRTLSKRMIHESSDSLSARSSRCACAHASSPGRWNGHPLVSRIWELTSAKLGTAIGTLASTGGGACENRNGGTRGGGFGTAIWTGRFVMHINHASVPPMQTKQKWFLKFYLLSAICLKWNPPNVQQQCRHIQYLELVRYHRFHFIT